MWLHKENEYEWKYCGIWLDMIEDITFKTSVLQHMIDVNEEEIFLCFESYETPVEMFSSNLYVRNSIFNIQNNKKLSPVEKDDAIKLIEEKVIQYRNAFTLKTAITVYLNEQNRFVKINLI